jgi:hypothetical protein
MSEHPVFCYQYVNRPYEQVSEALIQDAVGVFERATQSATSRAQHLVSSLKVAIAGFEVGKNVVIRVKNIDRNADAPGHVAQKATRLELEWQAETNQSLFPSMRAALMVYPLSATETQLDLRGAYIPPAGLLGSVADKLALHRIAEATVHRFLDEIASRLSTELA